MKYANIKFLPLFASGISLLFFFLSYGTAFAVTPSSGSVWANFQTDPSFLGSSVQVVYVIPFASGHVCSSADISSYASNVAVWYYASGYTFSTGLFSEIQGAPNQYGDNFADPMPLPSTDYLCFIYSVVGSGSYNVDSVTPFQYVSAPPPPPVATTTLPVLCSASSSTICVEDISTDFGLSIIITLLFIAVCAMLFNMFNNRKKKWQRS